METRLKGSQKWGLMPASTLGETPSVRVRHQVWKTTRSITIIAIATPTISASRMLSGQPASRPRRNSPSASWKTMIAVISWLRTAAKNAKMVR